VAAELLPALREALSNIARHAQATAAEIDVENVEGLVTLCVRDNGHGLSKTASGGNGLLNLAKRAEKLGGHCSVVTRAGGGCELEWQVPA
jgi:signal transduction histidine kinase